MIVSLVGAGPGDPGLLTLRGRDVLATAQVIIYDALANPAILAHASPEAELIYVGKVADKHALPQDEINKLLVEKARANGGQKVARLKGGDPYIFGRGGEEAEYLQAAGVPFEVVPGVTSAIAAPAYAGIPLTHREYASSVSLITGHENPEKSASALNWDAFAKSGSTLVFLMGMRNLDAITARLLAAGMDPATPAALIYRGATPRQRVLVADLQSLARQGAEQKFSNPAIIVIGRVVTLREQLDWYSRKPLLGRRVVVTRAREQASELARQLEELGAEVIQSPAIAIADPESFAALDEAIAHLGDYHWLIFTSVNGVKYFWQRLNLAGGDSRSIGRAKVAAIGPATGQALAERGIIADLVPGSYVAESVAAELIAREGGDLAGIRILLPRAAKARPILPDELARAGAIVDVVDAYMTKAATGEGDTVRARIESGEIDCVTFGSSSTVDNFLKIAPPELLKAHPEICLAAIGPITARTLAGHGLQATLTPAEYAIPALTRAIADFFGTQKQK